MKMSELIAAYGDDKAQWQNLDDCASSLVMSKRGTKITFGTDERLNLNGTERLGLVVWLDRERVQEIVAASKAALGWRSTLNSPSPTPTPGGSDGR